MYEKEIVIVNETGLHARPATEFVQLAGTFASTITLRHAENERAFNAKSILMVLSMGLDKGAAVTRSAQGPDEREAVEALVDAIKDALANTPAELAGDLMDAGIHLSGGGALLSGLDKRLHDATNLPVFTSDLPQDDVAMGLARISAEERTIARLAATGALAEG